VEINSHLYLVHMLITLSVTPSIILQVAVLSTAISHLSLPLTQAGYRLSHYGNWLRSGRRGCNPGSAGFFFFATSSGAKSATYNSTSRFNNQGLNLTAYVHIVMTTKYVRENVSLLPRLLHSALPCARPHNLRCSLHRPRTLYEFRVE
jgi:hypothetical protein